MDGLTSEPESTNVYASVSFLSISKAELAEILDFLLITDRHFNVFTAPEVPIEEIEDDEG